MPCSGGFVLGSDSIAATNFLQFIAFNFSFTTLVVASWIPMCDSSHIKCRKGKAMALRKQFSGNVKADPELIALMESSRHKDVTEAILQEQRISFAFGNAMNAERITKASVRATSKSIRLLA